MGARCFGYSRKVVRYVLNPCYNGTYTLFGRGLYPIRNVSNESKELSERRKAVFAMNLIFDKFFVNYLVDSKIISIFAS